MSTTAAHPTEAQCAPEDAPEWEASRSEAVEGIKQWLGMTPATASDDDMSPVRFDY